MSWFIKRLLTLPLIALGAVSFSFLFIHLVPGDPIESLLGELAQPDQIRVLREQLGLNRPLWEQYIRYLRSVATGDLGESLIHRRAITPEVLSRLYQSARLAIFGGGLAISLGLCLGLLAVSRLGRWTDRALRVLSLIIYASPSFCIGPLLMWLFAIRLQMLPVNDCCSLPHLILPGLTLGVGLFALIFQHTRSSLIEALPEDYMRTAQAKGLSHGQALLSHALPNAAVPILTIAGALMGALLSGTLVIETLFDWPGLGSYLVLSLQQRDYPAIQACVLVISLIIAGMNLITDLLQHWIHPQTQMGEVKR